MRRLSTAALATLVLTSYGCNSERSDRGSAATKASQAEHAVRPSASMVPSLSPRGKSGPRRACSATPYGVSCSDGEAAEAFVPGRLIVKLRDGLSEPADVVIANGMRFADVAASGGADLDRLGAQYRVLSASPLFSSFFPHASRRPGHGSAAERRRGLREAVSAARAAFPKRARRAPPDAALPDLTSVFVLEVPSEADIPAMARAYSANPNVEYAVPDYLAAASASTNDPYLASSGSWGQAYGDLWALHKIGAPAAWSSATGNGAVVGVVDTGLDRTHPDIAGNVWANAAEVNGVAGFDDDGNGFVDDVAGWDFAYGDADPRDGAGHGTHVSGTIAAIGDNGVGVVGVAYQARIMPVKGLDDAGHGTFTALANAIAYAARNGADVINNSWGCMGSDCGDAGVSEAIALARNLGSVVVFAAGNSSMDVKAAFPANVEQVITVSATGADDSLAWFTNWGYLIDVAAPGGGPNASSPTQSFRNILSLRAAGTGDASLAVGTSYLRQAGTSMAAPHVAGVAALLLSANSSLTAAQVESIVRHSAADMVGDPSVDTTGYDPYYGWGRLDAAAAVALASAPPEDPPILKVVSGPMSFDVPYSTCATSWALPFDVYNLGGGTLSWTATAPEWLTVSPSSGTSGTSAQASLSTFATRTGMLAVDAPGALDGHSEIPVSQTTVDGLLVRNCNTVLGQTWGTQQWDPFHHLFRTPSAVADGTGGAIYVWTDTRNGNPDLFMQRVDSSGNGVWTQHGKALTSAVGAEGRPAIMSDGAGGAIVVYAEGPNSMDYVAQSHIRAQHVDAAGRKLWGTEGVWLCQATGGQMNPSVVSDGAGGAIAVWNDYRSGTSDVYAQRISADGMPMWQANGVPVSTAGRSQFDPVLASDGLGGAFITWTDARTAFWAVYAQRIDSSGTPLWEANGIEIAAANDDGPNIVSDGDGGAIIAWNDFRNLAMDPSGVTVLDRCEIYATRVDGDGNEVWFGGAVPVLTGVTASPDKFMPGWQPFDVTMAPDGHGGAFFVWHDARSEVSWDLYAQHLDVQGNRLWGASGAPVTTAANHQIAPTVVSDGREGALFAWSDFRPGSIDIYMQRLGPTGAMLLPPGGLWVESRVGDQNYPQIVPLARRRFLITWDDEGNCVGYSACTSTGIDFLGKVIEFNDAPVANAQTVSAIEDSATSVTLSGSDGDGDSLTYAVVDGPAHGTLSGTAPELTYTPAENYGGDDAFAFKVNDGTVDSAPASVTIFVSAVNDVPVASAQSIAATEDTALAVMLSGSDGDGDSLTYAVVDDPAHGTLSGTAPELTYTPAENYGGGDAFTFKVNDGTLDSTTATVSVVVAAVNDAPVASPQALEAQHDAALSITLSGSDVEGDPLTYTVAAEPSHGTLSGPPPDVTYTPAPGYAGEDAFTFVANDGSADSEPATVGITVLAAPPEGGCGCSTGADAAPIALVLAAVALRGRRRRVAEAPLRSP